MKRGVLILLSNVLVFVLNAQSLGGENVGLNHWLKTDGLAFSDAGTVISGRSLLETKFR